MRCETGEFPIKIIQGDSYRRVYKFYDTDGNVMDNSSISSVVLSVSRLNYTQTLNWNAEEEGYVFILSAETTSNFPYCKGTYDVTLNFVDHQVSTQVYQSSWQVFEKDVFYNTLTNNKGYMTCEDSEVVIKTGLMITTGGIDDHNQLINRNLPNQHPMSAITGLEDALESKQPSGDYATTQELDELAEIVEGKADADDIPTKTSDLTNDSDFTTKTYVDDADTVLQGQIDDLQAEKMPLTEIDTVPTDGSTNLVESGGVYDAIDAVQQDVDNIEAVISTQATPTNKLVSASEMGDAISSVEAKQLYATSSQGSFATKAQLLSATTFYNADGTVATPTKNDIAYVLADESHSGKSAKYVIADITSSGIVWGFVITFSDTTFSQTQMDAINSGVTQQKVSAYDSHIANKSNPHEVTYQQLGGTNPSYTKGETDTLLNGKLSDAPSDGKQYARKDGGWSEVVSGDKSAIIIPYASLGITPYTFAEVKALLDGGNEVKVQTGSYIPHCTSYSNSIITFFDITSWDLGAGVYTITYVHLRDTNAKYTYNETEPLNPVVYARIAPNYSDTSDYAVGDYCTRYENIYRCTTAIIGGEEWDSSHWVAVTVMGEIQQSTTEIKEDLGDLDDRVTEIEQHGGGTETIDIPYDSLGTGDYTYAKLITALTDGKLLRVLYEAAGHKRWLWLQSNYPVNAQSNLLFFFNLFSVDMGYGAISYMMVTLNENNVKEKSTSEIPILAKRMQIIDAGNYYTSEYVEGALQEIGAELSGINTLIGSGVIV